MPSMPNGFVPVVSPGGYSHDGPGGVMRTDIAGGAPRYAMDWDRGVQRFNVTLLLDAAQYSVWVAWYHHVIKKGALTFDMLLDSGFGLQQHAVNIVPGSYSAMHQDTFVIVAFVVEGESKAYEFGATDAAALVDLYNTYESQSNALLDRLAQFATADTNVLDL